MRLRVLTALLLAAAVAGCGTKPVPPPVVAAPPPPAACKAAETVAVAFKDILPPLTGKCIKTRGLAVRSLLYENGASFAKLPDPGDHAATPVIALLWRAEEPAALKSHPQFVEFTGRVVACTADAHCVPGAPLGISVSDFRIIPTAMD